MPEVFMFGPVSPGMYSSPIEFTPAVCLSPPHYKSNAGMAQRLVQSCVNTHAGTLALALRVWLRFVPYQ